MCLELDEAENDLRAGAFEIPRPADIRLFVEPRLQFDQRRHGLAGFGSFDQSAHDRAIGGRSIKRLLDGDDIGIARRLGDELDDDVERFVRVVNDEIFLFDRRETIAAIVAHALGKARIIGLELQLGAVEGDEFAELVESEHAVENEDFLGRDGELACHETAQGLRHMRVDLQPDDRAAPAPLQRCFEEENEILGFFLDFEIAVADHPEKALAVHCIAGKQARDLHSDQIFEHHETRRTRLQGFRQAQETLDLGGQADKGIEATPIGGACQLESHAEAEIGNEREGMRWIDCKRCQDRENVHLEMVFEPFLLVLRQIRRIDDDDARRLEILAQLAPAELLFDGQDRHPLAEPHQLLGRRKTVLGRRGKSAAHLAAQTSDTDHEEFVEVIGRDRQEAHLLEQRVVMIRGLFKHPAIEFEPGQFAIDEPLNRMQQRRFRRRSRSIRR